MALNWRETLDLYSQVNDGFFSSDSEEYDLAQFLNELFQKNWPGNYQIKVIPGSRFQIIFNTPEDKTIWMLKYG